MVVFQCRKCDEITRVRENELFSLICQKCGSAVFTFDGECEFESKEGEISNTDGVFSSLPPHLFKVRRIISKKPEVEKTPEIKVIKKEEEEEPEVISFYS